MNLKKYMSVGHVVEDLNHLHGRYNPSKPGMIPRFEQRKLGAARSQTREHGARHIVFSSKTDATLAQGGPNQETHATTQPSGAHRKVAFHSEEAPETAAPARSRHGVFKRAHKGGNPFQREDEKAYQPDLFEKVIPIDQGPEDVDRFELKIHHQAPMPEVAHELPEPKLSLWRRCKGAVSHWLRQG